MYFQGRLELDTDRSLLTGMVHTPFIIDSPFNEIPSWGWDVAIQIQGGDQGGSNLTPFYLDFGAQSPTFFPFGEKYNDGRWLISGNQLILEGNLSMLDGSRWRYLPNNGSVDISRVRTDGRIIGRLFTNYNTQVTDMIPKNDNTFDTGTNTLQPAIQWVPSKMVSRSDPGGDVGVAQWDLTKVDGQLDDVNLVISGTLARLDANWLLTGLVGYIDTDFDSSTGIPIANPLNGGETIGADYQIKVLSTDLYSLVGYSTVLVKADGSGESHDSWLNMNFSVPNQANSSAQSIVTVPLSAIGSPKNGVRLYLATINTSYGGGIEDIAPTQPLSLINEIQKFQLTVNALGTGKGAVTSTPPGYQLRKRMLRKLR